MTDTPEVNSPTEKEYTEIVKSEVEVDSSYIEDSGKPAKITYYCRACKAAVTPKRVGKSLGFKCSNCDKDVSFGTESSVHSYYNIK